MDLINLLLPALTFGAGYLLNFLIDRRARDNAKVEDAARHLVDLLNDWHEALNALLQTFALSTNPQELARAFGRYQARQDILTRIAFELAVLSKYKKSSPLLEVVQPLLVQGKEKIVADMPSAIRHLRNALAHHGATQAMELSVSSQFSDAKRVEEARQQIVEFYGDFEKMLREVIQEASALVAPSN